MSAFDKNKIFFALVHYILSEQHNVDWILKTSLINFTGLNTTITNKRYKQNSVTRDIIEYIYQCKPYHVQFEQFIEKHSSKDDIARINATDDTNTAINVRFDAIQPYSDIELNFYDYYVDTSYLYDDEISDDEDYIKINLPNFKDGDKRNVEGLLIFSELFNSFFSRHYDEDKKEWVWVKKELDLKSDKYYFAYGSDSIYKVINDGGIKTLERMTEQEIVNFMDTHKANRLWYLKRNVFNEEEIKEYIIDVLNAHFKGITLEGSKFDYGKMGYDAFLYDEKLYDEPTLSNMFCVVDFTSNEIIQEETPEGNRYIYSNDKIKFDYTKSFIPVGVKTLLLDTNEEISEENCRIYYKNGDSVGRITNFNITNNMLKLPYALRMYEEIQVINTVDGIQTGFIFVAHPFKEEDTEDSSIMSKFVDKGTTEFSIPENNIGSRKILVYLIGIDGSRKFIKGFKESDGSVIIDNLNIPENNIIQISVIDYGKVYDKIYTWEDRYGNSNNVTILDSKNFLRANYEAGRPSELAVSYPLDGSMIYGYNDLGNADLYRIDWKDSQSKVLLSTTMKTTLSKDINLGDTTIEVENADNLFKPILSKRGDIIPAKILVNSEIIEYHDMEKIGKKAILKGIRRASSGSILNEFIPVEYKDAKGIHKTEVYAYEDRTSKDYPSRMKYISTLYKEGMENKFNIPYKFSTKNKVCVYRKPFITLLTDIKFDSKYFDISDNNIILPAPKKLCHIKDIDEENIIYDDFGNKVGKLDGENVLNDNDKIIGKIDSYGYVYDINEKELGSLIINGDTVYFKTITETKGKYRIKGFNITKEYKASESKIYSNKFKLLDPSEYEIVCNKEEDIRQHMYIEDNYIFNPIDDSIMGVCVPNNEDILAYKINGDDKRIGYVEGNEVKNSDDETIGYVTHNIVYDLDDNLIGYIKSGLAYKFEDNIDEIMIGYVNNKQEIVDEHGRLVEYPYVVINKDAYVILNDHPEPLEVIVVGNEK